MRRAITSLALAALLGAVMAGPSLAKDKPAAVYKAPRGPGGHPDLSGVWQVMNTANWNIEPHAASAALAMRPGPIVPVPAREVLALGAIGAVPGGSGVVEGGEIPYTPEARAKRDENRADVLKRDPEIKCYLPGVPRANYMDHPFQIYQSDTSMVFFYEFAEGFREIFFKDPGEAPVDSWMGQSVGKWEGDSLVVTVTGQVDGTWFDRAGNHHSSAMVVVERYTPTSPNTMRYEATITDPETFTRPWKMSMNLYRRVGEDARLHQFKCVEFVEELIFGPYRKEPVK